MTNQRTTKPGARPGVGSKKSPPKKRENWFSILVVQILLCLVLALSFILIESMNGALFTSVKTGISALMSSDSGSGFFGFLKGFSFKNIFTQGDESSSAESGSNSNSGSSSGSEGETSSFPDESNAASQFSQTAQSGQSASESIANESLGGMGGEIGADDRKLGSNPPTGTMLSPYFFTIKPQTPVVYGVVTSWFGYRLHPITGAPDFHTGIDIAAAEGSPVLAAYGGTVSQIGVSETYGNYIVLDHSGGVETVYSHCGEIIAPMGAHIRAGDRIATVGSTGLSTGPHLHFEIRIGGVFVDPMKAYQS